MVSRVRATVISRRLLLKGIVTTGATCALMPMVKVHRAAAAAPPVLKPTKLSVLFPVNTDTERDAILKRIDMFQKANPSITVSVQNTTWAKLGEIVQTRVLAGDEPSVMLSTADRLGFYGPKLADMKSFMPSGIEKEFAPDAWLGVRIGGKLTGLPNHTSVKAAVYNVNYFEKIGLRAPKTQADAWTWEQLAEAARRLQKEAGAKYGVQFEKRSFHGFVHHFWQNGSYLMDENHKKALVHEKAGVETIKWAADLHKNGIAAPGMFDGTEDPLRLFASGITAIWLGPSNTALPSLVTQMRNFRWDYMYQTKHPKLASTFGPAQWAVFQSANLEAAWKYVSFMTSEESMAEISSTAGTIPVRAAIRDRVKWKVGGDYLPFFFNLGVAAFDARGQAEANHSVFGGTRDQMQTELALAATGVKTPEAAAEAMSKILSGQLKG